jgi:hypothetical protein
VLLSTSRCGLHRLTAKRSTIIWPCFGELSAGDEVAASLGRGASSRRGSAGCEVHVSAGGCTGADFPLAKIVAALGWAICPRLVDLTGGLSASARFISWSAEVCNHPRPFEHDRQLDRNERGGSEIALLAEGSEGFARRLDVVEPADEADEGLSTLLRQLPSRGRAAFEVNEGRRASPAVLSSTIT